MDKEEKLFIEFVERLLTRWGYKELEGRIYGILLVSRKPLTIADLVNLTGMSRTSVSTALNRLARDYLVTYTKNGKTKLFTPIPAFTELFMKQPRILLEREVRPASKLLEKLLAKADAPEHRQKLLKTKASLDRLATLLEEIIAFEAKLEKQST